MDSEISVMKYMLVCMFFWQNFGKREIFYLLPIFVLKKKKATCFINFWPCALSLQVRLLGMTLSVLSWVKFFCW